MNITEKILVFKKLIQKGGPETSDFEDIKNLTLSMMGQLTIDEEKKLYDVLKPILIVDTMIGHTFLKPYGYAGDFELIDKIYNFHQTKNKSLIKWDALYHAADSSAAVRNRKEYFINLISETLSRTQHQKPNVLNLGSGPCTDLYEYLTRYPENKIIFDCVDMDKESISFASTICDNYIDSITFINKNVFHFRPEKKYDLIWSAGLFDYFSDKLFIRLINRMYKLLEHNGILVIGNFSTNNPSRGLMEIFCQWYLHHRNEEHLTKLALKAGIKPENISVNAEPTGINLFLHLKK